MCWMNLLSHEVCVYVQFYVTQDISSPESTVPVALGAPDYAFLGKLYRVSGFCWGERASDSKV